MHQVLYDRQRARAMIETSWMQQNPIVINNPGKLRRCFQQLERILGLFFGLHIPHESPQVLVLVLLFFRQRVVLNRFPTGFWHFQAFIAWTHDERSTVAVDELNWMDGSSEGGPLCISIHSHGVALTRLTAATEPRVLRRRQLASQSRAWPKNYRTGQRTELWKVTTVWQAKESKSKWENTIVYAMY